MKIAPQYRIYACFFLYAIMTGGVMARLPDLQTHFALSESQLGLTMIGMAIGSLISLTLGAPVVERIGPRTTAFVTVLGPALLLASIPWMSSPIGMFVALFFTGFLGGAFEINLNVQLDRLETHTGKRYMNRAHGFWSVGFFVTALFGAMIRQSGLTPAWHLGLLALAVLLIAVVMLWNMQPAPKPAGFVETSGHAIAFPNLGLLPLCLIGFAAFLVEGAGIDWSAIYMRNVFDSTPLIGGMGLTLFAFFMAAMRLTADPLVSRYGPRNVAIVLLALAGMGALLVGVAPEQNAALIGFALMGLGCSAVYPIAVSAAAQRTDRPAAVNVAALGQVSFVVFFLAPPLLGFVAEYLGIRMSYLICLPLLLAGLVASYYALDDKKAPTPIAAE
ncbi:MFS transporter [Devosia sp. A369]